MYVTPCAKCIKLGLGTKRESMVFLPRRRGRGRGRAGSDATEWQHSSMRPCPHHCPRGLEAGSHVGGQGRVLLCRRISPSQPRSIWDKDMASAVPQPLWTGTGTGAMRDAPRGGRGRATAALLPCSAPLSGIADGHRPPICWCLDSRRKMWVCHQTRLGHGLVDSACLVSCPQSAGVDTRRKQAPRGTGVPFAYQEEPRGVMSRSSAPTWLR